MVKRSQVRVVGPGRGGTADVRRCTDELSVSFQRVGQGWSPLIRKTFLRTGTDRKVSFVTNGIFRLSSGIRDVTSRFPTDQELA